MSISVDTYAFVVRLKKLWSAWKDAGSSDVSPFGNASVLVSIVGVDAPVHALSVSFQSWLLGYECPDTAFAFAKDGTLTFFSSKKKLKLLEPLQGPLARASVTLVLRTRDKANPEKTDADLVAALAGDRVGGHWEEPAYGDVAKGWRAAIEDADKVLVDVSGAIRRVLSVKDDIEVETMKLAGHAADKGYQKAVIGAIDKALTDTKAVSHATVARQVEDFMADENKLRKLKMPKGSDLAMIEMVTPPRVASGKSLRRLPLVAGDADENPLTVGPIALQLDVRYTGYFATVARTLFVDPKDVHKKVYESVTKAHTALTDAMRPGVTLAAAYAAAQEALGDLAQYMTTDCGAGIGLQAVSTPELLISASNEKLLCAEGMTFVARIALEGVPVAEGSDKTFSVLLADTVIVTADGVKFITTAGKKYGDVSFTLDDSEDEEEEEEKEQIKKSIAEAQRRKEALDLEGGAGGPVLRRSTRETNKDTVADIQAERERREHQKELLAQVNQAGMERMAAELAGDGESGTAGTVKKTWSFTSYKRPGDMPLEASKARISVDQRRNTVLVPIFGGIVPFHAAVIKNVTKTDDYLRLQLISPVSQVSTDPASFYFKDPKAHFVKELSFRISDESHLQAVFRAIKEIRKQHMSTQTAERQAASLVEQGDLVLSRGRAPRLTDVSMRPSLTGRKTTGTLEAHENGFRFRSDKGGKLDVLYSNVRHAFFQPAKNELITVIHLHLRNDIMIGKKKARDVQFYTEVMEASQALDSRFQAFDGIEEEQRERELLNRINKEFQNFVRKVDELTDNVEFDLPYRELGFYGTPHKTNVLLQPTVHCLINVTEFPFFVVSLDDIEMVYLERVSFSLKNFDMVIVYKDYSRPVSHINAIPVGALETIKEWLDSCSIYCSEGATSLNWVKVMKTIRDDLEGFYEGGGWSFLDMDGSDDDEEHPSDEESDFEEESMDSDAASSSDDSFSDGSFTEEDEESEVDLDSEEEEGLSWDELERKAKKEDEGKRKRYDEDDLSSEEERRSSKKKKKSRR